MIAISMRLLEGLLVMHLAAKSRSFVTTIHCRISIYIYICIYTYLCTKIYTYVCMYIYICVCVCVCMHNMYAYSKHMSLHSCCSYVPLPRSLRADSVCSLPGRTRTNGDLDVSRAPRTIQNRVVHTMG